MDVYGAFSHETSVFIDVSPILFMGHSTLWHPPRATVAAAGVV